MIFTDDERTYLREQRWGRLATTAPDGTLQNSPVGYDFDPGSDEIRIHGFGLAGSKKFRNLLVDQRMAFVVDDVPSEDPIRVRCLELRGDAVAVADGGRDDEQRDGAYIVLRPRRVISFGIGEDRPPHELRRSSRAVVREADSS